MQIHLIEASEKLLAGMSGKASRKAFKFLNKLGVNLWLGTNVQDYNGRTVLTNKEQFESRTVIWTAGVKASYVNGLEIEPGSRIPVDSTNKIPALDSVYALGDIARMETKKFPSGHPMLASVAAQQGAHLARNLNRKAKGKSLRDFIYNDKGTMATIGRNLAVVDLKFLKFGGFFAWLTWMFVHLMLLVDCRSRILVFINWLWNYINYDKGTRLIIRKITPIEEHLKTQ